MNFIFLAPLISISMFSLGYYSGLKKKPEPKSDDTFYLLDDIELDTTNEVKPIKYRQQLLNDIVSKQYHLKKLDQITNKPLHPDPFNELHQKLKQIYRVTHDSSDI
jgi:hypothetical protein